MLEFGSVVEQGFGCSWNVLRVTHVVRMQMTSRLGDREEDGVSTRVSEFCVRACRKAQGLGEFG